MNFYQGIFPCRLPVWNLTELLSYKHRSQIQRETSLICHGIGAINGNPRWRTRVRFLLNLDPYLAFFYISMWEHYCRALKKLSFGILHDPLRIVKVPKKQNGRQEDSSQFMFLYNLSPKMSFFNTTRIYNICRGLKMLSNGVYM